MSLKKYNLVKPLNKKTTSAVLIYERINATQLVLESRSFICVCSLWWKSYSNCISEKFLLIHLPHFIISFLSRPEIKPPLFVRGIRKDAGGRWRPAGRGSQSRQNVSCPSSQRWRSRLPYPLVAPPRDCYVFLARLVAPQSQFVLAFPSFVLFHQASLSPSFGGEAFI